MTDTDRIFIIKPDGEERDAGDCRAVLLPVERAELEIAPVARAFLRFLTEPNVKAQDGDDSQASAFTIDYVEVAEERMPAVLRDAGFHARLASGNGKSLVEFAREEGEFSAVMALRRDGTMVLYSTCESDGTEYEDIAKPETVQAAVDAFRNWRKQVGDAYLAFFESLYGRKGEAEARKYADSRDTAPYETAFFGVMEDGSMRKVFVRFACVAERYAQVSGYRAEMAFQDDGIFPEAFGYENETRDFSSNEELAVWAKETFAGILSFSDAFCQDCFGQIFWFVPSAEEALEGVIARRQCRTGFPSCN